jgi:hypothetical protein
VTLYYGQKPRGARLDGPERALDGFIGLIVLVVEALIGLLVLFALNDYATACSSSGCQSVEALESGYFIALIASGTAFVITTIVYLVRLASAKRSWPAPLWGLILVSAACTLGWIIMVSG